jgi:long-subunit fatty acid transport protein
MRKPVFFFLFSFILLLSLNTLPQGVGQYEDEAPLRSWNILGIASGKSSSLGGITVILVDDLSAIFTNPSVSAGIDEMRLEGGIEASSAELYRYSLVNTGAIASTTLKGKGLGSYFIAFSLPSRGFNLSFAWGKIEDINRPSAGFSTQWGESLAADFSGRTSLFSIALSKKTGRVSFGLGFNYLYGFFARDVNHIINEGPAFVYYTEQVKEEFSGYYFTLGTTFELNSRFNLAFSLRTPYERKGEGRVFREMETVWEDIIGDYRSSDDRYAQPLALLFGGSYRFSDDILLAFELDYLRWSSYRVTYFADELPRNFKDTFIFRLGAEYNLHLTRDERAITVPLRIGYLFDPQPVPSPNYRYHYLTCGSGFSLSRLSCDFGFQYGFERSSGENMSAIRFITSLSYRF